MGHGRAALPGILGAEYTQEAEFPRLFTSFFQEQKLPRGIPLNVMNWHICQGTFLDPLLLKIAYWALRESHWGVSQVEV